MVAWIVIAVVVFHACWYALTRSKTREGIPDEKTIAQLKQKTYQRFNITIDRNVHEETFIEANGGRLHLNIFENSTGSPILVFIPGTSVYAGIYIELLYAIYQQGLTVVGFDPRGHGQSSGPRGDYTMNTIVDDALAVVDYAGKRFDGKVAVAGSSQGGMAAFYAAARNDSLAPAVCHNIADLNGRDNLILSRFTVPAWTVPFNDLLLSVYQNFALPVWLYLDLTKEILKDGTTAAAYVRQDPLCVNWIKLKALRSLMKTPLARPVENITVPIMLVHSDEDNIFPQSYVEGIFNRLTCPKEYLLLKGRDHLVMTNHVDEVVGPITDWLKKMMM